MDNNRPDPQVKELYVLSREKIKWLIGYYVILFVFGLGLSTIALLYQSLNFANGLEISVVSLIGGFGAAIIGSTIFYLRKLYKACIKNEISTPTGDDDHYRELGVFAYYFLRPIFSIAFSLLIHVGLKSSAHAISANETRLGEGFIYLTMLLSFFAGFASGDLITYIESKSQEVVTKIVGYH